MLLRVLSHAATTLVGTEEPDTGRYKNSRSLRGFY
uniref:Uncharacterized protein n=1 Tax=Anguilla anguilla TaxID=7936 RepID=A0A0E9R774_ANGAN